MATLSSSPLVFGVTAKLITGSGKPSSVSSIGVGVSENVARSCISFSFATAPMSPAPNASAPRGLCPASAIRLAIRSFALSRAFTSAESAETEPE